MADSSNRVFIREFDKWRFLFEQSFLLKERADVRRVENGLILPLRPVPEDELEMPVTDIACRGGVCDEAGCFVAGHQRNLAPYAINLECVDAYEVGTGEVEVRHERVVFGGILYRHLGHALVDSFARLWYLVACLDFEKVVFLHFPWSFPSDFDPMKLVGLLGIPKERIEIVDAPTRFDEVIVPDEAFISFEGYLPECTLPFQQIAASLRSTTMPKKVYLSRCGYQAESSDRTNLRQIVNETYYEQFFARRGFQVVYPEQLPIEEQIGIVANADEVVSAIGTTTHLLLFARPDVKATVLVRESPMMIQSCIEQMCGIEPYYVEATSNPLPVDHMHGPYLMMPTRYFRQYLDARGIAYDEGELEVGDTLDDLVMLFLREWAKVYREFGAIDYNVASASMADVVVKLNDTLFGVELDRNEVSALTDSSDARALQRRLDEIEASTSWKVTAPLRAVGARIAGRL